MAKGSTSLIYLDTEFTSLGDPWPVHIISAALVDSNGREIYYAENADFDVGLCHGFCRSNVLPLLNGGSRRLEFEAFRTGFFDAIASLDGPQAIVCDSIWDWVWVASLACGLMAADARCLEPAEFDAVSGWPANLARQPAIISWDALGAEPAQAARSASSEYFKNRFAHHALDDAKANALAIKAAMASLAISPGGSLDDFKRLFPGRAFPTP